MALYHVAQLNVARPRYPLDHPAIAEFIAALPEINALADGAPGFVWRLRDDDGQNATSLRPFGPDIMLNMSVWESIGALRDYLYRSRHLDFLRRRHEWFRYDDLNAHVVLWWVPAGEIPLPSRRGNAWRDSPTAGRGRWRSRSASRTRRRSPRPSQFP
ncbi:MAG TPA: DUF3291 domain-containing protein [Pilimelia sp.]|nr:DUF3291 domain-containing protein [Pilimelia sp.]